MLLRMSELLFSAYFTFLVIIASGQAPCVAFEGVYSSPYKVCQQNPYALVNDSSQHLFVLNKTEWAYFVCRYPEYVIGKARQQGISVIRVCLEGTPYFQTLGYDLWPWQGTRQNPQWDAFNTSYWDEVERRIRLAGENGIGIDLCLYFTLKSGIGDTAQQKKYWQYTLDRLAKYANIVTWEVHNEYITNETFQDVCGRYLKENDPFQRPVCTSDGTTDDAVWPHKDWMGLAVVHTCTGSTPRHDLEKWYLAVARNTRGHGKPAFNNETGRENRHKNDDPVHRRKQSWLSNMAGCFWTYHSWEGCEGIDDTTYTGPGAEFLLPLRTYFDRMPHWSMSPNFTVLQTTDSTLVSAAFTNPARSHTAVYLCTKQSLQNVTGTVVHLRLPDGRYRISYIDTSNLTVKKQSYLTSSGLGKLIEDVLPPFMDDILLDITAVDTFDKSLIEGTQ